MIYLGTRRTGNLQKDAESAFRRGLVMLLRRGWQMLAIRGTKEDVARFTLNQTDLDVYEAQRIRRDWATDRGHFIANLHSDMRNGEVKNRVAAACADEKYAHLWLVGSWGGAGNEHGPSLEKLADAGQTKRYVGEIAADNYGRISFPNPPAAPDKDSIEPLSQESIGDCCRGFGWRLKLCSSCGWPLLIQGKKAGAQKRHDCCKPDGVKANKRKYWNGPKNEELNAKARLRPKP